jgi:hypothetical protein
MLLERSLTTFFPMLFCAFPQIDRLIGLYGLPFFTLFFGS